MAIADRAYLDRYATRDFPAGLEAHLAEPHVLSGRAEITGLGAAEQIETFAATLQPLPPRAYIRTGYGFTRAAQRRRGAARGDLLAERDRQAWQS